MKIYLNSTLFFLVALNLNSSHIQSNAHSVIKRLNSSLKELNNLTYLVVDFSQIVLDELRASHKQAVERHAERCQQKIALLEETKVNFCGYRDSYSEFLAKGAKVLTELLESLKEAENNYNKCEIINVKLVYKDQVEMFKSHISTLRLQNLEYIKKIREVNALINEVDADIELERNSELEFHSATHITIPKDGIELFRIFSNDISEQELAEKLGEISSYVCLKARHFTQFDQSFIENNVNYSEQVLELLLSRRESLPNAFSLREEHVDAAIRATELFKEIFSLELIRRDIKAKLLEEANSKPCDGSAIPAEPEEQHITTPEISSDEENESPALEESAPGSWVVRISDRMASHFPDESSRNSLESCLKKGPRISKEDELDYRFSNFSGFSTGSDFHCHLNNRGNSVAVWKVLDWKARIIEVYYIGKHPKNYLKILKKAKHK